MATRISATALDHSLSEILNRVLYREERFIIERSGKPVARLEPVGPQKGVTLEEVAEKLGNLKVPHGFADAVEAFRRNMPEVEAPEWAR